MASPAKQEQIQEYFSGNPLAVLYGLIIIIGIIVFFFNKLLGILMIGLPIYGFTKLKQSLTDQQIEDEYRFFAEAKMSDAKEACGISDDMLIQESEWFWYVDNFIDEETGEWNEKEYKEGDDKITRANTRGICILNYGKDQIFSYQIVVNIGNGKTSDYDTSEYFYQDVVGIEVEQNTILKLKTTGGPVSYYIRGNAKLVREQTENEGVAKTQDKESGDISRTKAVVSSVRQMTRERKRLN